MNADDVLKYGHLWVLKHVEGLSAAQWETAGVCGWWSVKNILAHLASFEHVLVDVLCQLSEGGPTPDLDQYIRLDGDSFNDVQVSQRKSNPYHEILAEYAATHKRTMELIRQLPLETRRKPGLLPWYGAEYDLEDYITYAFYGHKREHCAQIAAYRDTLK